jgi:RHS repeat-associated protein
MRSTSLHTTVAALAVAAFAAAAAPARAQVEYYHLDGLGSVRAVTNQQGQVVERHDYLPFGEECTVGDCAGNPQVGAGQAKKFTGKERDTETGLDYFGARYYGSRIGRFTTIDPVFTWEPNLTDPQRWNRYAYGRDNPLRYVDPDGRVVVNVRPPIPFETAAEVRDAVVGFIQRWDPNPLDALGADMALSLVLPKDQRELKANVEGSLFGMAIPLAGAENAAGNEILSRFGTGRESAARLARKAAAAEGHIGIHGVSVTAGPAKGNVSTASRASVEQWFTVHDTPTRADPLHRTVELPKPITERIAETFNRTFGRDK